MWPRHTRGDQLGPTAGCGTVRPTDGERELYRWHNPNYIVANSAPALVIHSTEEYSAASVVGIKCSREL